MSTALAVAEGLVVEPLAVGASAPLVEPVAVARLLAVALLSVLQLLLDVVAVDEVLLVVVATELPVAGAEAAVLLVAGAIVLLVGPFDVPSPAVPFLALE